MWLIDYITKNSLSHSCGFVSFNKFYDALLVGFKISYKNMKIFQTVAGFLKFFSQNHLFIFIISFFFTYIHQFISINRTILILS